MLNHYLRVQHYLQIEGKLISVKIKFTNVAKQQRSGNKPDKNRTRDGCLLM